MSNLPVKHHTIISGTGRAGTTFLIQLFTVLGFDTGFQDIVKGIFQNCQAGMEIDIRDPQAPYVIKSPWICEYLDSLLAGKKHVIDHAIIPVRDLFAAAESRRNVQRRTPNPEQYGLSGAVPGGFFGTTNPAEQEQALQERFYQIIETLVKWNIPTTLLHFPRFIHDPEYLYAQLSPLLKNVSYDKFLTAFAQVARPDLVHPFQKNGNPASQVLRKEIPPVRQNSGTEIPVQKDNFKAMFPPAGTTENSFFSPSSFLTPEWLPPVSAWFGHAPFAFWLTEVLRPGCIVELGAHWGFSYLTLCQSVKHHAIPARCYAIDTWLGDEHSGFYQEDVYAAVNTYNQEKYSAFSKLVCSTFDDAVSQFQDGSIDLLHIDGHHTYESVKHDFELWLPRMSKRGVILFHDTNVHERNFGVWRLWKELSPRYPHFEFFHEHGLGVLGVGDHFEAALNDLFSAGNSRTVTWKIRQLYSSLGSSVKRLAENNLKTRALASEISELTAGLNTKRSEIIKLADDLSAKESEITKLTDGLSAKESEITKLAGDLNAKESDRAKLVKNIVTLQNKLNEQSAIIQSAEQWQRGPWLKRALHRWQPPDSQRQKINAIKRLERSIRKRRKLLANKLLNRKPQLPPGESAQTPLIDSKLKVTVIVPNYNHSKFLEQRLNSIYSQTYKNFNVILLDDCSTDGSLKILQKFKTKYPDKTTLHQNETNSGGPFKQWKKGITLADGDLIWIAESDDFCDANLLESLVGHFLDESIKLAYCQTVFVDSNGKENTFAFKNYVGRFSEEKWLHDYVTTAHNEVNFCLGIKNTIPNASAVVFRKPVYDQIFQDENWLNMKICGDWVFYLWIIRGGKMAYTKKAKSYYRFHAENASASHKHRSDYFYREHAMVAGYIARLYKVDDALLDKHFQAIADYYNHLFAGQPHRPFALEEVYDLPAVKAERKNRRPNVLMACHDFACGGGEMFPINLATELRNAGYGLTFFDFDGIKRNDDFRENLPKDIPLIKRDHGVETSPDLLSDFGIEIINSHHASVDYHFAKLLSKAGGLPLSIHHVVTMHGMYEMDEKNFPARIAFLNEKIQHWVYVAEKNVTLFKKSGYYNAANFTQIPEGVPFRKSAPALRRQYRIPDDAFVVCVASRAVAEKGWLEAIEAVQLARNSTAREIHLLLIGDGTLKPLLEKKILPDHVHLLGFQKNVREFYAMADIGLLASTFSGESCPLTLLECMSNGKPVIASDLGEIRNMLTSPEGETAGFIIPIENGMVSSSLIAEKIGQLAVDRKAYDQAAALAVKVVQRFDIAKLSRQYEKIFNDLLAG